MKLLLGKLKFKVKTNPLLISYPAFRDFQQQFLPIRHVEPVRYLKITAKDSRTKMFVFPSRLLHYKYLLTKIRELKDKRPLLKKSIIYPVLSEKRYIVIQDKFFRKINADIIYAYVEDHSPFSLTEFLELMNELQRDRYAYMYTLSSQKIRELEKLNFEYIVLNGYKLSSSTASVANKILDEIYTRSTGQ